MNLIKYPFIIILLMTSFFFSCFNEKGVEKVKGEYLLDSVVHYNSNMQREHKYDSIINPWYYNNERLTFTEDSLISHRIENGRSIRKSVGIMYKTDSFKITTSSNKVIDRKYEVISSSLISIYNPVEITWSEDSIIKSTDIAYYSKK